MTISELKQVCESIKGSFSTFLSVEQDQGKEGKELSLGFKDFSPKKDEEQIFKLNARISDVDESLPFGIDLTDKVVEVYKFFGAAKYDDTDFINQLLNFGSVLTYKKNLQLFTFNAGDDNIGLVLRAYVDVITNQEEFRDKLYHVFKEFLSFHYAMRYMVTKSKITDTLDDAEMIESLMQKHRNSIELLLNPETIESL